MSTGQAAGAAVGVAAAIIIPGGGALTAILMGASIGMAVGGMIDPPKPETPDLPFSRDLQFNTFDRDIPLPVCYGRVFVAGPVLFIGKVNGKIIEEGGGKDGPESSKTVYKVDFAVALCEGPIEDIVKLYKGDDDKTDKEGAWWDVVRGTAEQDVRSEVEKVGIQRPVPWRHTAYVMWHDKIGEQPHIPIIAAEFDALRTTRTASGSYSRIQQQFVKAIWGPRNRLLHILLKDKGGILTMDQEGAGQKTTGVPSGITQVNGYGVWDLEEMAFYIGQVDSNFNRYFAIGLLGDDGTGAGRWITDQLATEEWGQKILAETMDQKWGRYIAVVQTATKTTLLRLSLTDLTEEKWELPSGYGPGDVTPQSVFYDHELDDFYVCVKDKSTGDYIFLKAVWGATTVETTTIGSGLLSDVPGFGRAGDFIIGADRGNKLFRFVFGTAASFDTYGTAVSSATGNLDQAPPKGKFGLIQHASYAPMLGRMLCLAKTGTDWYITLTEWDGWNWSYVGQQLWLRTSFERKGDPAGACFDYAKNTRFGAAIPESVIHVGSFEDASAYCGEDVHNGEQTDGSLTYAPRWQVGFTARERRRWLEGVYADLLPAMTGFMVWQGGKLDLMVHRPVQVVAARLGHDRIIEGSFAWKSTDREESPNGTIVDFRDADDRYRHDLARANNEGEQARSGEVRQETYELTSITNRFRAYRMAQLLNDLTDSQRILTECQAKALALDLRVGEGVALTHDLLPGGTDKIFRVMEMREEPEYKARLVGIEHAPTAYRTPLEGGLMQASDFGKATGEGEDTSAPTQGSGLKPPVRVHAVKVQGEQAVVFPFSRGPEDGTSFANANFERGDSASGPFNNVVARGNALMWSMLINKTISAGATEIPIVKDSVMEDLPDNNSDGYLLIGSEIIKFGKFKKPDSKFTNLTRGAKGTTAAEHEVAAVSLDVAYKYDAVSLDDVTEKLKTRGWHNSAGTPDSSKYVTSSLKKLNHALVFGATEKFNSIFAELAVAAGGKSLLAVEYSSDADGGWKPVPGLIDLTDHFKKGDRTYNSGYENINNSGDEGYTGEGRPIYFDPPQDWTKTAEYSSSESFPDSTPRYYIRVRQLSEITLENEPAVDWIVLKRSAVAIEFVDDDKAVKWAYPDALKGTTQYIRATAVGKEGQLSDTAGSPVVAIALPA